MNPEEEKQKRLIAFREEINKLIEDAKIRNRDPEEKNKDQTLEDVGNAENLDQNTLDIWEEYKRILDLVYTVLEKGKEQAMIEEKVAELLKTVKDLVNKNEQALIDTDKENLTDEQIKSKKSFFEWMRNRLSVLFGEMQLLEGDLEDVAGSMESIKPDYDRFVGKK